MILYLILFLFLFYNLTFSSINSFTFVSCLVSNNLCMYVCVCVSVNCYKFAKNVHSMRFTLFDDTSIFYSRKRLLTTTNGILILDFNSVDKKKKNRKERKEKKNENFQCVT